MPAVQYPFIDIAVHERVREKFAGGEAMALFSMDMKNALWANGRGAALFGTPLIYDLLEHGPKAQDVTFRQLAGAASRLAKIGDRQQFTIRVLSGFRSVAVAAIAEVIEAEPGQPAILFSAALDQAQPSLKERARRMIEGFDDADIHMAVLDDSANIIAASDGFAALGIAPQTARTLISMASGQEGKLVKRPVPTGKGYLPAATGQLTRDPALNLVFVVETALGTLDPSSDFVQESAEPKVEPIIPQAEAENLRKAEFASVLDAVAEIEEVSEPEDIDGSDDEAVADDTLAASSQELETEAQDNVEELVAPSDSADAEISSDSAEEVAVATAEPQQELALEQKAPANVEKAEPVVEQTPPGAVQPFAFNPNGRASRFVWKIDANGRFSSISHEFADAVGQKAAAVEGMSFSDLAALFNLDPEGKIAELLNRRDTWSGKTIYWPVEGTSLVVPIDLAALPTYTRSREFDGFRGFGIVRIADAVEDPNAVGLALSGESEHSEQPEQDIPEDETVLYTLPDDTEAVVEENELLEAEPEIEDASINEAEAYPEPPQSYEPPETEVPVLKITETPGRRYSDKVVRFEEHRNRVRDGLSASEEAAFREIGRTLKPVESSEDKPVETEALSQVEIQEEHTQQDAPTQHDTVDAVPTSTEAPAAIEADEDDFADYTRGDEPVAFTHIPSSSRVTAEEEEPKDDGEEEAEKALSVETLAIRHASSLTAEIVDQMPLALLIHSGDRLFHANPEFLRLTGYADIDELADVGGLDALLQRDDLQADSDHTGGMIAVTAENDLVPVRAKLQSVRWDDAGALMLSLIPTEMVAPASLPANENQAEALPPENIEAEDAANVTKMKGEIEELHSILETATDGVVLVGEDGNIRSLNRSANALFNYDTGEIANKPFVTLFAHESQRAVLDYLSGLANNGVASVLNDGREVIGREASGGFLPLFMTIGRLKSTNGYCAVIRDITQWKRTEEDLRNAKRAAETANAHKTDFLARVSHEIRTPLNAIIGFADMMATERFGPVGHPRYIEYSNDIVRSGRHVLDIVNDLLDISKIEAGQMDVDFRAVSLNETIAEAVSIVQPQANNQRVIIRTALSQSVPQIVADLRSIKQILLNILSNAIKFTPSGGQIVVSTAYEANGSVTMRIRDTGIGMTRSELEQAMKPFRQVSASSSRVRGDGTGLGLPLTKAMVDANRANFSITSTPNEGTLVEISFPSQRVLAN
ncbi:ATP-binding protein [Agrobacterium larrymoorei]|uniref:histidine kinase n=1 Tax=Agrobacterium larrymoorei TaxID=160699 RepID=A0A4D7DRX6_9HYPH|nr:ATP-binding protein [Agrobacterium larrymoorei]QCI99188.1 PAS domain S-box protein [Agrobacterium larrymoorei]QYA05877.1 PAS domain S-box protein [Agrobacterium larrymoorei]